MLRPLMPWLLGSSVLLNAAARAAEPEQLPVPRESAPAVITVAPALGYQRVNRREVWQYYGVDRYNQWRPRVVATPYGAYYLINGQPYPWVTMHPREVEQMILDTPNR